MTSKSGGDHNQWGRYCEVLFKAECLKRGICVLTPECTHLAFDAVVFVDGKFYTVQIKGTRRINSADGHEARFQMNGSACKKTYAERGVDYFAGYVQPLNAWFIVPIREITGKTFALRLGPDAKATQWRDNWTPFGG